MWLPWEGLKHGSAALLVLRVAHPAEPALEPAPSFTFMQAAGRQRGGHRALGTAAPGSIQVGLPRGKGVLQPGAEGG